MIEIMSFREINKGCLIGYMKVFVTKWGFEFNDVAVFEKNGKRWISLMQKEYEKDGEKKYNPCGRFRDQANSVKFQESILEALRNFEKTQVNDKIVNDPEKNTLKRGQATSQQFEFQQSNEVPF